MPAVDVRILLEAGPLWEAGRPPLFDAHARESTSRQPEACVLDGLSSVGSSERQEGRHPSAIGSIDEIDALDLYVRPRVVPLH